MDRKQEIQNQIAELQRELRAMSKDVIIYFNCEDISPYTYCAQAKSLSDADIINAMASHPKIDKLAGCNVAVWCDDYSQTFHVTKVVSYNITPF